MPTAHLVATLVVIAASVSVAVANFLRLRFVREQAARLRVPESFIPVLGALQAAAAVGLLLGLAGVPFIGEAAAGGLILYFAGAIVMHRRAGDGAIGPAITLLLLAAIALVLALMKARA